MPDEIRALAQRDALDLAPALRIEQAKLNRLGVLREKREIDSGPVPGRSQGIGAAAPNRARRDQGSCGRLHRRPDYAEIIRLG